MLLALVVVAGAAIKDQSNPTFVAAGVMVSVDGPTQLTEPFGRIWNWIVPVAPPSFRARKPTVYLDDGTTCAQDATTSLKGNVSMVRTRIDPELGQDTASSLDQVAVPWSTARSQSERSESKSGLMSVRVLAAHLH
jgi:hypothetical protein